MVDDRKPLQRLITYVQQVVSVAGRLKDFQEQPFFYILIKDHLERSVLHIRAFQSKRIRIFELGEGAIDEPVWAIRMREDGMPVDPSDFNQTPYQIERLAKWWVSHLNERGYLQQAAYSYMAVLSPNSTIWRPEPQAVPFWDRRDPVSEEHYAERLEPQEGILLRKRIRNQPVAKAVGKQYFHMLEQFYSSGWFDTAIIRATVAARFNQAYFVQLSPVSCSTGWRMDRLSFPVSACLLVMPSLLYQNGLFADNYTNEGGSPFINSYTRELVKSELRREVYGIILERDLHFLYCPNCQKSKVAKSIDPPPYACKHCGWKQRA